MSYLDIQQFLSSASEAQQAYQFESEQQSEKEQQELTRRKAGEGILSIKGADSFREGMNFKGFFKDKFNKAFDDAKEKVKQKISEKVEDIKQQVRDGLNEVVGEDVSAESPASIRTIGDLAKQSDDVLLEYKNRIGNNSSLEDFKAKIARHAESDPERELAPDKQDIATNAKQHVDARSAEPEGESEGAISAEPEMAGDIELSDFSSAIPADVPSFVSPEITGALRGDTTLARVLGLRQEAEQGLAGRFAQLKQGLQQASEQAQQVGQQVAQRAEQAVGQAKDVIAEGAQKVEQVGQQLAEQGEKAVGTLGEATEGAVATGEGAIAGAEGGLETAGASLIEDPFTAIGGLALLIAGLFVGKGKREDMTLPQVSVSKQYGV